MSQGVAEIVENQQFNVFEMVEDVDKHRHV